MNVYLVSNKTDDYGNGKKELVETTLENAKEYYCYKKVAKEDVEILKKYFYFVEYDEEKDRSNEERFYGHE